MIFFQTWSTFEHFPAFCGESDRWPAPFLALVTDGSANAGAIIKEIAPLVGGKGGGKPDLAQGGGTNPEALPSALEAAKAFVSR